MWLRTYGMLVERLIKPFFYKQVAPTEQHYQVESRFGIWNQELKIERIFDTYFKMCQRHYLFVEINKA